MRHGVRARGLRAPGHDLVARGAGEAHMGAARAQGAPRRAAGPAAHPLPEAAALAHALAQPLQDAGHAAHPRLDPPHVSLGRGVPAITCNSELPGILAPYII